MVFIPQIYTPPNNERKNRKKGVRTSMGGMVRNSLNTSQGISILMIVLIYSVVGMVLNWVLPIVILAFNPEMMEEDAHYLGTVGAMAITGILLLVSLVSKFIFRRKSGDQQSKTHGMSPHIFGERNSETKGNMDGR